MAKQNSLDIEKYILVTELNRKFCIRLGRKCHVISCYNKVYKNDGDFFIRPRLKKGWFYWGKNKCFVSQDEERQTYIESFKEVIDTLIKEKRLYIQPKEQIIKFDKP